MCRSFPVEIVEWACDRGLDLERAYDPGTGGSAWHAGVTNQNPDFLDLLQQRAPESINNFDFNEFTALFDVIEIEAAAASSTGIDMSAAKKHIDFGIDVNHATESGLTALHLALYVPKENTLAMLRILLDGFDINSGEQTLAGTILHALVVGLRDSIFLPTSPSLPEMKLPFMSTEYETGLRERAVDMCRAILEYGPDLEAMNVAGVTAFELADCFGFEELAKLLEV